MVFDHVILGNNVPSGRNVNDPRDKCLASSKAAGVRGTRLDLRKKAKNAIKKADHRTVCVRFAGCMTELILRKMSMVMGDFCVTGVDNIFLRPRKVKLTVNVVLWENGKP